MLDTLSPIIGAFPDIRYKDRTTNLGKDDDLILCTDGIIEARNNGEFFEEECLIELIGSHNKMSVKKIPQTIFDEVAGFTHGRLTDDAAVLAVSLET